MPSRFEGSEHGRQRHKSPMHPLGAGARPASSIAPGLQPTQTSSGAAQLSASGRTASPSTVTACCSLPQSL